MLRSAIFCTTLATLAAACGASGMGQSVRDDITARMQTARDPIATCYHEALQRNPELRGTMMVSFVAEAKTGTFSQVRIARSEIADPKLETCVTENVAKLALETPQKAGVAVTYPIRLTPSNPVPAQ